MLQAAIRTHAALYPEVKTPPTCKRLAEILLDSEDRLDEWRASAARAGADEALSFVLSWYEDIDLNVLKTMRIGSKWTSELELIQKRQETAYAIAQYADMHTFIEDPNAEFLDAEEGEAGADDDAELAEGSPVASEDPDEST
jgi:hypothetical protein